MAEIVWTDGNPEERRLNTWCEEFNELLESVDAELSNVNRRFFRLDVLSICLLFQSVNELLEFILKDDGITLFSLNNTTNNYKLATVLYFRIKDLESNYAKRCLWFKVDLKRWQSRLLKWFTATNRRYRKEYMKYLLTTYFVPHAFLIKQEVIPKELVCNVISYL